ncbi:sodium/calcium exchanger 1 [Thiorhodovibrio winogradskyi]|uniref:Sodium/calcium exchanger 1 n=2 Tax=Thiorhodovibrio winogradskyi TaxID=77007 RepID=A0ABZ0SFE7_9GAMM
MPTTVNPLGDGQNSARPGRGFDGVVRISTGSTYGTGVLLFDGRAVLTVAHVLSDTNTTGLSVAFDILAGTQSIKVSRIALHPDYDRVNSNRDLALLWLSEPAPISAERYDLYRNNDEIGKIFTFIGYGETGTGDTGALPRLNSGNSRLKAENRFEADAAALTTEPGVSMPWRPILGDQLIADFDNGQIRNDALGQIMGISGLGLGDQEGMLASGDSGGPAFISGDIAGIASYNARLSKNGLNPDIDVFLNSSYGELGAWTRVSSHQQWIDQQLRSNLPNAPTTPAEVRQVITEGNDGTSLAYFMVSFNGMREDPDEILSVDFATRDGTAMAGSDYLAVDGTLNLYPNENQAVIAVEVIGDLVAEPDETFHLDITNPIGGAFPGGAIILTATRTIVDDDGWV